ncbi:lipase family protein (plasmid) [Enterobacter kobei]|uniref:lipase family protein n=1 Tax=Enterobacter kobei TaxID=208224 RepID=UPI003266D1DA
MKYAFQEVPALISRLNRLSNNDPHRQHLLAYLCSLFAEVPYHHIPELEFDDKKRAKIISSKAYRELVASQVSGGLDVSRTLAEVDYVEGPEQSDVVIAETERTIAVGVLFDRMLFIGFRGTILNSLSDWYVNARLPKTPLNSYERVTVGKIYKSRHGSCHKGFGDEAKRISSEIMKKLTDRQIREPDEVYLTGHSLGGAVAALSQEFIKFAETHVFTYGAPRYCDKNAVISHPYNRPQMYRREGDMVPSVPPLWMGYGEEPVQYGVNGEVYPHNKELFCSSLVRWIRFGWGRAKSHDMENYRADLGRTAKIAQPDLLLVPHPRIAAKQLT